MEKRPFGGDSSGPGDAIRHLCMEERPTEGEMEEGREWEGERMRASKQVRERTVENPSHTPAPRSGGSHPLWATRSNLSTCQQMPSLDRVSGPHPSSMSRKISVSAAGWSLGEASPTQSTPQANCGDERRRSASAQALGATIIRALWLGGNI